MSSKGLSWVFGICLAVMAAALVLAWIVIVDLRGGLSRESDLGVRTAQRVRVIEEAAGLQRMVEDGQRRSGGDKGPEASEAPGQVTGRLL